MTRYSIIIGIKRQRESTLQSNSSPSEGKSKPQTLLLISEKFTSTEYPLFSRKVPRFMGRYFQKIILLTSYDHSRITPRLKGNVETRNILKWKENYSGLVRQLAHGGYFVILFFQSIRESRKKEVDVISNTWSHATLGFVASVAGTLVRKPVIINVTGDTMTGIHSMLGRNKESYLGKMGRKAFSFLELFAFKHATVIWSVSEGIYQNRNAQRYQDKIMIERQENAIAASCCKGAAKTFSVHDPLRAIYVGRLEPEKGVDILIRAISLTSSVHCTIVGDGSLKKQLVRLSENLRIDQSILFTGLLNVEQVKERLMASDVMILPSYTEYSPNALIEASSIGLPIITSDLSNVRLLLGNDGAKYFPPGDWVSLSRCLQGFTDSEEFKTMVNNTRERICSQYSENGVIKNELALINDFQKRQSEINH
jgi:glycosyltransferase involved in cell wall biosynthesis